MQLFQLQRQRAQSNDQRLQQEVQKIHRVYRERISMPRKLRQYEAKSALMKVAGLNEEQALETIAKWNAACQQRKRERLRQQKLARQAKVPSSAKQAHPISSHPSGHSTVSSDAPFQEPNTQFRCVRRAVQEEARALLRLSLEDKLRSADLISHHQLEIARMEQLTSRNRRTLAEILVDKGWIKSETIYFFETILLQSSSHQKKLPVGYYLQLAGLLTKAQMDELHLNQRLTGLSFEDAVESMGWVKRNTIYFLNACLNA